MVNRQRFREYVKWALSFFLVYSGIAYLYYLVKIKNKQDRCRVLVYHRIRPDEAVVPSLAGSMNVAVNDFEKQIKFIQKYFHVLSLEQITDIIKEKKSFPPRALAITFDDGYRDNYTMAFPILKAHSIPATIFVTTGYINTNRTFWWDAVEMIVERTAPELLNQFFKGKFYFKPGIPKNNDYVTLLQYFNSIPAAERADILEGLIKQCENVTELRYQNLSWDEIMEMDKHGVAFGSHTVSHAIASEISKVQLVQEIVESKQVLENRLKKQVHSFAYPRGAAADYNDEVIQILKDSGYTCAVTNIKGINYAEDDLYRLKRSGIYGHESYATFICRCFNLL